MGFAVVFYRPDEQFDTTSDVGINVVLNVGINETQLKIVDMIRTNPAITIEKIADIVGITRRRVESNISKLNAKVRKKVDVGLLKKVTTNNG